MRRIAMAKQSKHSLATRIRRKWIYVYPAATTPDVHLLTQTLMVSRPSDGIRKLNRSITNSRSDLTTHIARHVSETISLEVFFSPRKACQSFP